MVVFSSTISLPSGITAGTKYYVGGNSAAGGAGVPTDGFWVWTYPNPMNDSVQTDVKIAYVSGGSGTHTGKHSVITTSTAHGLKNDDVITITGNNGVTGLAGTWVVKCCHAPLASVSGDPATNLITWASHGLSTGDMIVLYKPAASIWGTPTAQKYFVIYNDANTFYISSNSDNTSIDIVSITSPGLMARAVGKNETKFQLAPLDANMDEFQLQSEDSIKIGSFTAPNNFTSASTCYDFSSAGSYLGGSTAVWIGKHHPYSEADMYDASNRFDIGTTVLGDTMFFAFNTKWPRKLKVNSDYNWEFSYHSYKNIFAWSPFAAQPHCNQTRADPIPFFHDGPYLELNQSKVQTIKPQYTASVNANTAFSAFQEGKDPVFDVSGINGSVLRWESSVLTETDPLWGVVIATMKW